MTIKEIAIKDLIEYENNPRHNENAVAAVAESIKTFGFKVPIIVDKDNVIVAGHTRKKAAEMLGLDVAPCIIADDLTPAQIKAFRVADNKTAELAEWDMAKLETELAELADIDFDMSGFGFEDMTEDDNTEIIEDEVPEVDDEAPPVSQLGDIWQLGRHRLMCGDSTDALNIDCLMNGQKADLVFTDPPYGMKKEATGVLNDNLNYDDLLKFNKQWIPLTFETLKDNGSWYCWGIDEPLMDIYSNILKPMQNQNKITFRNLITWDKRHGLGQTAEEYRMYPIADEKCLFVMKGQQMYGRDVSTWYEGFEKFRAYMKNECAKVNLSIEQVCKMTNTYASHSFSKSQYSFPTKEIYDCLKQYADGKAFKKDYEEIKKDYEEIKKEWYATRAYFDNTHDNMNNVWHFDRTSGQERELTGGHATPKPIALCSRAIKSSSREGENVLDVFGGSGSTLIACEQLNRNCYMLELNPKYCDVIIKRWETLTGEKAVKL